MTAPSNTVTLDGATSVNTVTINTQSDITKLLSITEPKGDTVTVTKPESKVVTVTTPGPPGPPLASATETDSLVSFDRDIATDKIYAADGRKMLMLINSYSTKIILILILYSDQLMVQIINYYILMQVQIE